MHDVYYTLKAEKLQRRKATLVSGILKCLKCLTDIKQIHSLVKEKVNNLKAYLLGITWKMSLTKVVLFFSCFFLFAAM